MWSGDLERFRFGRQGAPIFFKLDFARQPLVLSPKFFQSRVPPKRTTEVPGDMGSEVKFGARPPK